jgi:hypothetical protein
MDKWGVVTSLSFTSSAIGLLTIVAKRLVSVASLLVCGRETVRQGYPEKNSQFKG